MASPITEIKSHSSVLFNERMNILFTMLDAEGIDLEINPNIKQIFKVKSILSQIWKNLRPLVFYAPGVRVRLKLNTSHEGIYTIDSGLAHIQECINHMIQSENYSYSHLVYIVKQISSVEIIIKEVLQYFSYFIRPDYRQIPDFDVASEKYKEMADKKTLEQFKDVIGDRSGEIFDSLDIELEKEELDEVFDNKKEDLQ